MSTRTRERAETPADDGMTGDLPSAGEALMASLIDYAGLFPPTKLDMAASVKNYAEYLRSPRAWMLGRFIVPVSRLTEFEQSAAGLLPKRMPAENSMPDPAEQPWPISALIDGDPEKDLEAVHAFNGVHSQPGAGLAVVDAVEIKVPGGAPGEMVAFIDSVMDEMPEEIFPFFEMPAGVDPRGFAAAFAGTDAGAKVRTGGVTPEAIPAVEAVAEFIEACDAADVPFKATAGLHHAVRAEYGLTYEQNCPRGIMHGFLNVFVAAAAVRAGRRLRGMPRAVEVLRETDPKAFGFAPGQVMFRGAKIPVEAVLATREQFALSYGSCSFDEPTEEAERLGVVRAGGAA